MSYWTGRAGPYSPIVEQSGPELPAAPTGTMSACGRPQVLDLSTGAYRVEMRPIRLAENSVKDRSAPGPLAMLSTKSPPGWLGMG